MPVLVRMDTLKYLRAQDVFGGDAGPLKNTRVLAKGSANRPHHPYRHHHHSGDARRMGRLRLVGPRRQCAEASHARHGGQELQRQRSASRRPSTSNSPMARPCAAARLRPDPRVRRALHAEDHRRDHLGARGGVESLAREIARQPGTTLFAIGMGPNQFFNSDNKDRDTMLLAALTGNIGRSAATSVPTPATTAPALFNGCPQYINENPFDIELDPAKPARPHQYWRAESAHYYNHEDHPLKVGNKLLTGSTHIPAPTKSMWFANANSILGNVKWHFNTVINVLPRIEMIAVNEWWWTASCEWADIVFGVDSWSELKHPDMTASVTNPFLVFPAHAAQARLQHHGRYRGARAGRREVGRTHGRPALQRLLEVRPRVQDRCLPAAHPRLLQQHQGLPLRDLEAKAKQGIPVLLNSRTTPKAVGYDQVTDSKPWYTKSGRLEFYRDEDEFIEAGENLPVHREPVDSTFYEPNVIVAPKHEAIRCAGPEQYGVRRDDLSCETRCGRNVVLTWEETKKTSHPLMKQGFKFIFHTPKYRHGSHTTPIDTDMIAVLFGPFGDLYRQDKRSPFVTEGYVDINPTDAKEMGVEDGDYIWIDPDPEDRPFRGWQKDKKNMEFARLLCRARYYPGTPARRHPHVVQHVHRHAGLGGRAEAARRRPRAQPAHRLPGDVPFGFAPVRHARMAQAHLDDRLARSQTMFGQGSARALSPTSTAPPARLARPSSRSPAPNPAALEGKGLWRPAALGIRPRYESEAMKRYLAGGFFNNGKEKA
jgi:nitrate reductase / nitrite oxidoreductase, alpha subunit